MKVIHIYRNPIDVAESLKVRELKRNKNLKSNFGLSDKIKLRYKPNLFFSKNYYQNTVEFKDLSEGIKLWEIYTEAAFSLTEEFNIIHVKYEDLLEEPKKTIEDLSEFIGLDIKSQNLGRYYDSFDKSRMYAFKNNADLINVYEEFKSQDIMVKLGYSEL